MGRGGGCMGRGEGGGCMGREGGCMGRGEGAWGGREGAWGGGRVHGEGGGREGAWGLHSWEAKNALALVGGSCALICVCRYAVTGAEDEWDGVLDGTQQEIVSIKK
jgi:hypothetical protein